ncbi:hypothetical protein EW145_g3311 [Phellinidium pouzarii]|uniref:F-box domain-containing protein n=1 Tax=Phellinidium pouzarii TaxID=167371 RepID=A0A4S4L9H8_9AGAM|nr:hypothetical protein EW145_g3311 [Phellinidium pouzarii]
MFRAQELPFDVLPLILGHLHDRNDLYAATLVSKTFYRAATPVLYEDLDSRLISTSNKGLIVHHPAQTLLRRPELAVYIANAECVLSPIGTVHGAPQSRSQGVHELSLRALRLCTSIRSFSWVDDNFLPADTFLGFLEVLKTLPLQELTIRTFGNLGTPVWDILNQFKGLKSVSIFCMEGPPRFLQGWSETLSPTLTHLELGRCSGVPATILISVFSHLKGLTHLRIKGAPSAALPYILSCLPRLVTLDTDFNDANGSGARRAPSRALAMPALEVHGTTLERFVVGTTQLLLSDIACLCDMFPMLTELSCAIPNADAKSICEATAHACNLRLLRLNVQWFQATFTKTQGTQLFTTEDARHMMLRKGSKLRCLTIGSLLFQGQWVYDDSDISAENIDERLRFDVQQIHVDSVRSDA